MKKEDFIFTIGYQGDTAMVDKQIRKKFRTMSAQQMAEQGYYKAAFSKALLDEDQQALELVRGLYNAHSPVPYESLDQLKRLFGVFSLPDEIGKSSAV